MTAATTNAASPAQIAERVARIEAALAQAGDLATAYGDTMRLFLDAAETDYQGPTPIVTPRHADTTKADLCTITALAEKIMTDPRFNR